MSDVKLPSGRSVAVSHETAPTPPAISARRAVPLLRHAAIGWTYVKAVARWQSAGMPVRDKEEIARLFAICEACTFFTTRHYPHCTLCGCRCGMSANALTNKLAMATESCPANPPKWTATAGTTVQP